MLKFESPLSPATVEFDELTMRRLDAAARNFEDLGGSLTKATDIVFDVGYNSGSFVRSNADITTALAIGDNLVANLKPEVGRGILAGYKRGCREQTLIQAGLNPSINRRKQGE